jgi:hypothetical protein
MKLIILIAITLSFNALAAEKCRDAVAKQIPKKWKLTDAESVVVKPGADDLMMMGEVWNDLDEPLEYYAAESSNGYWGVYRAYGASLKTCKIRRQIDLGDDA